MRERESYREIILENIDYDILTQDEKLDRDRLDELVELMVDTVCSNRKMIRIAGDDYPAEVVKSRFLKIGSSHIEYVLERMRENTTYVRNIKKYAVANVKIDGKSIGAVKSYTFENVSRTHTIEVIFMKANGNPQTGVFVDVATGSYYEDAVDWAVENGITKGTDDTHFSPDGICTRAQAVTFLWRTAGSPASKTSAMPFTDVPVGSYYYDAVLWAVKEGVTKGISETTFSPDADCTRAQIVTFIWRALAE